jgi:hypothetical protein
MTDKELASMILAFFCSRLRTMDEFSSHGDVGKLTEEFWMVGGRSKFFIGGSLITDGFSAIIRQRLLDDGGLASVSRSSGSGGGISMLTGVPGSGLPAGSEMLRLKLSLRLSRRSWSPPSPAKHGGADDEVEDRDDVDDDVDDEDVDIDDEKQFEVGDSTDIVGLDDPDATETVSMFRVMDSVHGGGSNLLLRTSPRRRARAGGSNLKSEQVA